MNQEQLDKLSESDIAAHVQVCFGTPSGEIVFELLRRNCFMAPSKAPEKVDSADQALARMGLANLFRKLEYYRNRS